MIIYGLDIKEITIAWAEFLLILIILICNSYVLFYTLFIERISKKVAINLTFAGLILHLFVLNKDVYDYINECSHICDFENLIPRAVIFNILILAPMIWAYFGLRKLQRGS